ncbi:MAG: 2-oxo acid dehydrogenase subunit E2 [Firmicutes bacterium]|nr:2-oxo acid dehydrogenase subunit E2 [Bacillota bacterium]
MATEVLMPKLGLTMEEGSVNSWLKKEGEAVQEGEPLMEIMTDKAAVEVESPASGVLRKIIVPEGETVPLATVIAVITDPDEALPAKYAQAPAKPAEPAAAHAEKLAAPVRRRGERIKASPAAKRVAREQGLAEEELGQVPGTGPGGRITEQDVLDYVAAKAAKPSEAPAVDVEDVLVPVKGIRKVMAERMVESVKNAPQFSIAMEVDMKETVALRTRLIANEEVLGVRISYTDILAFMVGRALEEHPQINARWEGAQIRQLAGINVGIAVGAEGGLVVPVVKAINRKRLVDVAKEIKELSKKAQAGKLSPDELQGGTFTISNLGMFGVDRFTAIINPPESAILAVGQMKEQPVVVDGQVVVRPTMWISLTGDHRVLEGVQAARFLGRVKELLENPLLALA